MTDKRNWALDIGFTMLATAIGLNALEGIRHPRIQVATTTIERARIAEPTPHVATGTIEVANN